MCERVRESERERERSDGGRAKKGSSSGGRVLLIIPHTYINEDYKHEAIHLRTC